MQSNYTVIISNLIDIFAFKFIVNFLNVLLSHVDTALFRQNLTLNLNEPRQVSKQFGSLDLRGLSSHKELNMNLCQTGYVTAVDLIDVAIPLERQG